MPFPLFHDRRTKSLYPNLLAAFTGKCLRGKVQEVGLGHVAAWGWADGRAW